MGAIAALIGSATAGLSSILGLFMARKLTFAAAYIAIYLTLIGIFILVIEGLVSNITSTIPQGSLISIGLGLLPANTFSAISVIATAHTAALVFNIKTGILEYKVNS